MLQRDKPISPPRIHAYAASFGEDLARELIQESTEERSVVLDPFVGAGTTALEAVLLNRNSVGIDVDPIACKISRVLTSRMNSRYLKDATEYLQEELRSFETVLVSDPELYQGLGSGSTFNIGSRVFQVPCEPAIAFWFDPTHMATLSVIRDAVARELDPLVRQVFEVAISSSIIRKWPNTLSYAMDIDHSRPHRPHDLKVKSIEAQFALFYRVLNRVVGTILGIQEALAMVGAAATIQEGDSFHRLSMLETDSIDFVLTSPPYLNAIDYPRAHKFSQWWLSPQLVPLARSEYLGLRQAAANGSDGDCLTMIPALADSLTPFMDTSIYRTISRYVMDLAAVMGQLHRVAKARARVAFVVADNYKAGLVLPVSAIVANLLQHNGFSSVKTTNRVIKTTRRRYPFGNNGFSGPMTDEYLVTGVKPPA